MELVIDFESRSLIDIKKCGMYIYWQNPYTEVMMLSVKKDLEPTRVWVPPAFRHLCSTEIEDDELEQLMQTADKIIAHNAGFERQGFKCGMTKLGFSDIQLEKVNCTMAQASMCALPANLDSVTRIVSGGKYLKDEDGHKLMLKMSKPRAFVKKECEELLPSLIAEGILPKDAIWKDVKILQSRFLENAAVGIIDANLADKFIVYRCTEEDFCRLVEYARQDSQVERRVYDKLPKITESELEVWRMNERINDRGVSIDRDNCEGIKKAVNLYVEQLSKHAIEITGGKVTSMKSPSSILSWLRERGIDTDSIDKEAVNFLLTLELPDDVREFLEIRQKTGKSSVAKYDALLNYSVYDGRARGLFAYHTASTGRFASKGVQLQNLPRPSEKNFVKCGEDDNRKEVHAEIEDAPLLASCDFDFVEMYWKDPMILAADLIRPMMKAESGKQFICADYSAVEGRGLAWVAGQDDKVEAFRKGLDIYKVAASGVYKIPYEQVDGGGKGTQRQTGKTCELACFSSGTVVLTNLGWVNITSITKNHKLWDGSSWANHGGVIFSGLRKTVNLDGIRVTPDHLMFDGTSWRTVSSCVKDQKYMQSVRSFGESAYLMSELSKAIQDVKMFCTKSGAFIAGMKRGISTVAFTKQTISSVSSANTLVTRQKKQGLRGGISISRKGRGSERSQLFAQKCVQEKITQIERIIVSLCNVIAGPTPIGYQKGICGTVALRDALNALTRNLDELSATIKKMGSCHCPRTKFCVGKCTISLKHRNRDVAIRTTGDTRITVDAELSSDSPLLEKQLRGISHYLIAVKKAILSIESTIMGIMKKETSDSPQEENRQRISEPLENSKEKYNFYEPVYDIMNVGENNRFLVRGDSGFFIAHNCGYGGGWGAMLRFGADRLGLSEEEGKEIVKAWRQANDKIVKFWYALRDASIDAMKFPGDRIKVGKLSFRKRGSFLTMRLPSGRDLFYPNASLEMCDMPWIDDNTGEPAKQKLVTAMTLTAAKQWVRRPLSHVTLTENCVQAFCRDLLCYGLKNLEAEGYPIVMHIHDEAVAEVPKGYGSLGEFENLLAKLPEWAEGLPLRAEGWVGPCYRK